MGGENSRRPVLRRESYPPWVTAVGIAMVTTGLIAAAFPASIWDQDEAGRGGGVVTGLSEIIARRLPTRVGRLGAWGR